MTRYFLLLVLVSLSQRSTRKATLTSDFLPQNSFIILTLSASIITTVPQIAKDPSSAATILAQQLPKASTFFITYSRDQSASPSVGKPSDDSLLFSHGTVTLQAAGVAANLLQIVSLILYYVQLILLGGTPRNAYKKRYNMSTPSWGLTFPATTLLAVMSESEQQRMTREHWLI